MISTYFIHQNILKPLYSHYISLYYSHIFPPSRTIHPIASHTSRLLAEHLPPQRGLVALQRGIEARQQRGQQLTQGAVKVEVQRGRLRGITVGTTVGTVGTSKTPPEGWTPWCLSHWKWFHHQKWWKKRGVNHQTGEFSKKYGKDLTDWKFNQQKPRRNKLDLTQK